VILAPGFFFNCSHDDEAVAITVRAVRETFGVIADGLRRDRLDELLECPMQEELFRRMVS
jgi:hypothetical protein